MDSKEEANYRLRLREGFVKEADEYFNLSHWRSCVSSSQLAVENASKAVLAVTRPIVRIHNLSSLLLGLIEEHGLGEDLANKIERLAENARVLGFEEHIRTDYGDELAYKTPWEIYSFEHAQKALP
jgi:HEPN domain-containing protein